VKYFYDELLDVLNNIPSNNFLRDLNAHVGVWDRRVRLFWN